MKKKYAIIAAIIVLIAVLGIWLLIRPQPLGNINRTYSAPETSLASISFSGDSGEKIRLSLKSNLTRGILSIKVYDSKGNLLKELEQAAQLETFMILENSDVYTLEVQYRGFVGSVQIAVSKEGPISLPHSIF